MSSEFRDEEQVECQLAELMSQTDHLATARIIECESCGARVILSDERETCPHCDLSS